MPSRPPETEFYKDDANHTLWRDLSRVFEDFVGGDGSRIKRFLHVMGDIQNMLDPLPCPECNVPVVNVALEGVSLECPQCKWSPVTITGIDD